MTRRATPKLLGYLILVATLLVGALAAQRPELAILAAPFAAALCIGVSEASRPSIGVRAQPMTPRAVEGDVVELSGTITSSSAVSLLDVELVPPDGIDRPPTQTLHGLSSGSPRSITLPLTCRHWGGYPGATIRLGARTSHGFVASDGISDVDFSLRVYPTNETLRSLITPTLTQPAAGNIVARRVGSGLEFADVRPYEPGDELRQVNWRTSARRGSTWVTVRHAEQNADVILFLDTFSDIRRRDAGTLDQTVHAAMALASRYLQQRDRVGIVGFGGVLTWLVPGTGARQLYLIVESLITTGVTFSYAWKNVSIIPPRTLPPQALVIAISPLVDGRATGAILDLRRRRYDIAAIDVTPEPYLSLPDDPIGSLALRLWRIDRRLLLQRYRSLGIAVATWDSARSLEEVIEEVSRYRRNARIVSVS